MQPKALHSSSKQPPGSCEELRTTQSYPKQQKTSLKQFKTARHASQDYSFNNIYIHRHPCWHCFVINVYLPRHINKFFTNKPFQPITLTISATTNRISTNNVDTLYINKFFQQIMSTISDNQLASTKCTSANKVDKLHVNKFGQQVPFQPMLLTISATTNLS